MTLIRLAIAWAVVAAWFLLWAVGSSRVGLEGAARDRPFLATPIGACLTEALLLTLLASLWFASLGRGGWLLLFALLGAIIETSARFRAGAPRRTPLRAVPGILLGTARIVAAGALLAWRLG